MLSDFQYKDIPKDSVLRTHLQQERAALPNCPVCSDLRHIHVPVVDTQSPWHDTDPRFAA